MRKPHSDMAAIDDRILEHLQDRGFGGSATVSKSPHIDVTQQYISQRVGTLRDFELIHQVSRGIYQLTHQGRLYLAGAYDVKSSEYVGGIDPDEWQCDNWTEVWELSHRVAELEKRRLEREIGESS